MIPVFVFATMRNHSTQRHVLGEVEKGEVALLPDYVEQLVVFDADHYPTVKPSKGDVVKGEIIQVDGKQLKALDQWEHLYKRVSLTTSKGPAWVYIFRHAR